MSTIYDIKGNILFQDDNLSFKELVEKNKRYLKGANLSVADLSNFDLSDANLIGADLRCDDLSNCNLSYAYLSNCNLSYAYLSSANLIGADLRNVDLTGTIIPIFSKHYISYKLNSNNFTTSDINKVLIKIGCKEKTIKDWDNWFNSDEEYETKRGTEEFKLIQANYIAVREYLKFMVKGEN